MSERSNVSIAEILGDNYYIDKLTSSDYSPSVGDTVTITLSVNDVFGDPVTGQTRTVTCTGGSFVSVNGSSITSSSSVEVTTSSGGTVTLGLSVSVADNIVVSDGRCDCVVSSLSNSITNFNSLNTWEQIWTDGNVSIHCNKAIGVSYLLFNKNVTVSANGSTTIHSQFNSSADEIKCCPLTSTYCPTSRKDIYITVDYVGGITVYNRSSSAINNSNVQGMVTWRAKGYPE